MSPRYKGKPTVRDSQTQR